MMKFIQPTSDAQTVQDTFLLDTLNCTGPLLQLDMVPVGRTATALDRNCGSVNSKEYHSCCTVVYLNNKESLYSMLVSGSLGLLLNVCKLSLLYHGSQTGTGTIPFFHSQDILENCRDAFDCPNLGRYFLGPGTSSTMPRIVLQNKESPV